MRGRCTHARSLATYVVKYESKSIHTPISIMQYNLSMNDDTKDKSFIFQYNLFQIANTTDRC